MMLIVSILVIALTFSVDARDLRDSRQKMEAKDSQVIGSSISQANVQHQQQVRAQNKFYNILEISEPKEKDMEDFMRGRYRCPDLFESYNNKIHEINALSPWTDPAKCETNEFKALRDIYDMQLNKHKRVQIAAETCTKATPEVGVHTVTPHETLQKVNEVKELLKKSVDACDKNKDSYCFGLDSYVQSVRSSGVEKVTLRNLNIGDHVVTAIGVEPVLAFLHWSSSLVELLVIEHTLGSLLISSSHFVFKPDGSPIRAGQLRTDQKLLTQDREVTITRISSQWSQGFAAPMTTSGTIIVDGILCSVYADPSNTLTPAVAHGGTALLRNALHLGSALFSKNVILTTPAKDNHKGYLSNHMWGFMYSRA